MVYPYQGFSGTYVKHAPLGLLYSVSKVVQFGYEVDIYDTRAVKGNWRSGLKSLINDETLCVGISVMSGSPINHAIEIGRFVKGVDSDIPVIWGGPHATFYPETILRDEWSADYVVSGYASQSLKELVDCISKGVSPNTVNGTAWRDGEDILSNPDTQQSFEYIHHSDIPYHLISDYSPYGQLDQGKRIFSMYSALGCPYQCTFCSSPAQYKPIKGKKWIPLGHADIVDHIEYLIENYQANYIYFIDDDSFPNLKHVESIIDAITVRDIHVGLGFRGARINEIKRMSHEFLDKLVAGGTDIMHIGAESGSDRILKMLKKNSTQEDLTNCNRKLAKHPEITAAYNFIMGLPTETKEDLMKTRDLMLQLVDDHPNCIIFQPNKFRPLPGTELYIQSQEEWGYQMPNTLQAWSQIENEGDPIAKQWAEEGMKKFGDMLLITSYFVDNKIEKFTEGTTLFTKFARLVNSFYRPVARFRMRYGIDSMLVEYWLYRKLTTLLAIFQSRMVRNQSS
jgi:anaerobic magnesium-protoporphyrin IX monomethyl ester cyclase